MPRYPSVYFYDREVVNKQQRYTKHGGLIKEIVVI